MQTRILQLDTPTTAKLLLENFIESTFALMKAHYTSDGCKYLELSLQDTRESSMVSRNKSYIYQHVWKVNVWCGIVEKHIIGPFFFKGNLNGVQYAHFLENNLLPLFKTIPLQLHLNMFFQQDGCPAHISRVARERLNDMFSNKWIGKYGPRN